jgi:hypothetical protein
MLSRAAVRSSPALRLGRRFLCTAPAQQPSADYFSIVGTNKQGRAIYLDSQATTPLDPRALDAMLPYMTGERRL